MDCNVKKVVVRPDCTTVKVSSVGIPGKTGLQGTQGPQGSQGLQGLQGPQGLQGIQGESIEGSQGVQGLQGVQGTQGTQGSQGQTGGTGAQGTKGDKGVQGLQGLEGSQGVQGLEGSQGIQGEQGLQGIAGEGSQGIQGIIGIQGLEGSQGLQGEGSQGIQGIIGIQGADGSQGLQGLTGTGTQGIQGIIGIQGADGSQGLQGTAIQGIQGIKGSQGLQGTLGSQGTQGLQGTAIQGIQGIQGLIGIQGTDGGGGDLEILDEGVQLTATAQSINFVGNAIQATNVGNAVTVTVVEDAIDTQFLVDMGTWDPDNAVAVTTGGAISGSSYLIISGSALSEDTFNIASPSGKYGGEGIWAGINIWYIHQGYDTHITFFDSTNNGDRQDILPTQFSSPYVKYPNRIATLRKTGYYAFNLTATGQDGMLTYGGLSQYNSDPKIEDYRYVLDSTYNGKTIGSRVGVAYNTTYTYDIRETYTQFDLNAAYGGGTIIFEQGDLPLGQVATIHLDYVVAGGSTLTLKYRKISGGNLTEIGAYTATGTKTLTVMGLNDGLFCFEHP